MTVLPEKMAFRPMLEEDVSDVLRIIEDHDEEDAKDAEHSYQESGLDDQYVLTDEGAVIGVTGFRAIEGTDRRAWLSWTYLQSDYQGQGFGKGMLTELLDILRGYGVHKLFISTSDYVDPEDGPIYQKAIDLYLSMGFTQEITLPDYYAEDESQLLFGLALIDIEEKIEIAPEEVTISFNQLAEIDETEGVYGIGWASKPVGRFSLGKKKKSGPFGTDDCQIAIEKTKEWEGRAVLVAFPSNIPGIDEPLEAAGFDEIGMLKDYYQDGLHKRYFWYKL